MKTAHSPDNKFAAYEIAREIDVPSLTVSSTMRRLLSKELVEKEKFGTFLVYSLTEKGNKISN